MQILHRIMFDKISRVQILHRIIFEKISRVQILHRIIFNKISRVQILHRIIFDKINALKEQKSTNNTPFGNLDRRKRKNVFTGNSSTGR